ncbi:YlbG family protein [Salinithrix halophila]|uniref:YlbG family protein n=1 Tax=Salinithrix halophila TaxID=1485204 RepID=A0ABV8JI63_9BACL
MPMDIAERLGLAVWVKDLKAARSLGRMGNIHYVSKRLKYVFLYIDGRKADQTIRRIERMHYVTRVERSLRRELATEFHKPAQSPTT